MRVFFALEPDAATRQAIVNWRDRYGLAAGRPVPAANFHVTLAFIGNVSTRQLDTLCSAVDDRQTGNDFAAGELQLDRVGFWPGPAIYWMGTSQPPPQLTDLARKLQRVGGRVGARLEHKAFTPHVTLYRNCREPPPAPVVLPAINLSYRHFTLLESVPGRQGVNYRSVAQWELTR